MKKPLLLSLAALISVACLPACQSHYSEGTFNECNVHAMKNDYVVLGNVKGEAKYVTVLCSIVLGSGGYIAAYKDALNQCPGADDIIDVKTDHALFSVPLLNVFYLSSAVQIYGKAIKYKEPISQNKINKTPSK